MRLYLREETRRLQSLLVELLHTMTSLAREHLPLLMAGFTHLQPAQPIRFFHWVMSHAAALLRDLQRLVDQEQRINVLPLGSGALAGHAFGIDREFLRQELGFAGVSLNSLDAVCDRDFIAEFLSWAALTTVHLSQVAEDLIIYNYTKQVSASPPRPLSAPPARFAVKENPRLTRAWLLLLCRRWVSQTPTPQDPP